MYERTYAEVHVPIHTCTCTRMSDLGFATSGNVGRPILATSIWALLLLCINIMLEVAKQQVCMSVSCMLHTFLKYRDHYTSNIIVAAPMQRCNYYVYT